MPKMPALAQPPEGDGHVKDVKPKEGRVVNARRGRTGVGCAREMVRALTLHNLAFAGGTGGFCYSAFLAPTKLFLGLAPAWRYSNTP